MEVQNVLANRIDTAGEMLYYDQACKRVLASKIILAWILKTCLEEYRNYSVKEIADKYIEGEPEVSKAAVHADESAEFISGMSTESASVNEHVTTFDIKFRAIIPETKAVADMIINLEAQNDFYPGYPIVKRGIYYGSRMVSEQYGTVFTDSDYQKIKKVASIWICPNPPEYRRNTIVEYSFKEGNIVGKTNEAKNNYDLIQVVMICLGGKGKDGYSGLLKMLDILLSRDTGPEEKKKTLKEEFDIPMTKELEGGILDMCNLSKGVYDSAIVDAIKKLMKNKGWGIDECMDALEVPDNRRELYRSIVMGSFAMA